MGIGTITRTNIDYIKEKAFYGLKQAGKSNEICYK